jgi:hypothetical protein
MASGGLPQEAHGASGFITITYAMTETEQKSREGLRNADKLLKNVLDSSSMAPKNAKKRILFFKNEASHLVENKGA